MRNIILMCTKLKTTFTGNILQLFSSSDKALGHSVMLCPPCDDDDNSVQVTDRADWSQFRYEEALNGHSPIVVLVIRFPNRMDSKSEERR